jgi:hypothetical protein
MALAAFAFSLAATSAFLWHAHLLSPLARAGGAAALVVALWLLGRYTQAGAGAGEATA